MKKGKSKDKDRKGSKSKEKEPKETKRGKSKDKSGKKSRPKKDPDAPTYPRNPWQVFLAEKREQYKKEDPDKKGVEAMRAASEEWGELDEKDKKHYEELSEQDRLRYLKECKDQGYDPEERFTKPPSKKTAKKSSKPAKKKKAKDEDDEDEKEDPKSEEGE